MPRISLIVPVLFDAVAAARLLAHLPADPVVEIVLVDGAADPQLERLTDTRRDVRVISSRRGRAQQMNAGARASTGEWLIFLHADSRLLPGWRLVFDAHSTRAVGGWFQFALDDPAWQARAIEIGVRWRVRWFRLPYGDQGLFVRRATFDRMHGFRELPIMEDVDFIRRLVREGMVVEVPTPVYTSARRYRTDGWNRRVIRNLAMITLFFLGVSAERLAPWYVPGRR